MYEFQKYALHEPDLIVLHFDATSSVWGSVPGLIPLLCLKTPRKEPTQNVCCFFIHFFVHIWVLRPILTLFQTNISTYSMSEP